MILRGKKQLKACPIPIGELPQQLPFRDMLQVKPYFFYQFLVVLSTVWDPLSECCNTPVGLPARRYADFNAFITKSYLSNLVVPIPGGVECVRNYRDDQKWISSGSKMSIPRQKGNLLEIERKIKIKPFMLAWDKEPAPLSC